MVFRDWLLSMFSRFLLSYLVSVLFFFFNLWLDNIALYGFFSILNREKAGILKTFAEKILKRILMLKCTKRKNSHICQVRNF